VKPLVTVALLLCLGCVPRVTSVQFASDELARLALTHNRHFRPTYDECQMALNELAVRLIEVPPKENVLDIKVLEAKAKLTRCSHRLATAYNRLGPEVKGFRQAVDSLQ